MSRALPGGDGRTPVKLGGDRKKLLKEAAGPRTLAEVIREAADMWLAAQPIERQRAEAKREEDEDVPLLTPVFHDALASGWGSNRRWVVRCEAAVTDRQIRDYFRSELGLWGVHIQRTRSGVLAWSYADGRRPKESSLTPMTFVGSEG